MTASNLEQDQKPVSDLTFDVTCSMPYESFPTTATSASSLEMHQPHPASYTS